MIIAYLKDSNLQSQVVSSGNKGILENAVWIDLVSPTLEEETMVEQFLSIDIPTREELQEIEVSSRLYKMKGSVFMTGTMIAKSEGADIKTDAVTLILVNNVLVTVRYIEPQSFLQFILRLNRISPEHYTPIHLVIEFLESAVDRLADILERVGHQIDDISQLIFRPSKKSNFRQNLDYTQLLKTIGTNGDLNTKVQDSLLSFNRLVTFFEQSCSVRLDAEENSRIITINKDISSISNHANFLSNKIIFLLDATLGMVNIEQNNIIKIFSIAAVILLPPTLVASIYGMNFHFIPELSWRWGYPFSISLMVFSALLPYFYFKRRNWL
jgi:magnesium transporter